MTRVFFTDRDLGKQFPEILRSSGLRVERHADHFRPDTPDVEWLEVAGRNGWVVVTHDQRIRYKPNERRAVEDHRVPMFVIGRVPFAELAGNFVATHHLIDTFLQEHQRISHRSSRRSTDLGQTKPQCKRMEAFRCGSRSGGHSLGTCRELPRQRNEVRLDELATTT